MLQRIREACRQVAEKARQVRIAGGFDAYLASFDPDALARPTYDTQLHYRGEPADTLAFVLVLDAVNFGSGYFPSLRLAPGTSGYAALASGLTAWFASQGAPTARELTRLDAGAVAGLLGQDLEDPMRAELMRLYARALGELGAYLEDRFGGRFEALVSAADRSAERLAALLAEMPLFRDVWRFHGIEVPLYKRAQITASDLALAFDGAGWGGFTDLDRLTIFADNVVPHVLRCDGLLAYAPGLARRVDAGEPLQAGSPEEVEVRAVALHAVERLVAGASAGAGRVRAGVRRRPVGAGAAAPYRDRPPTGP